MNRIVDKVAIATEREEAAGGQICRIMREVGTKRTWVGSEADYLGAGKAVTVVALWTDEEGRDVDGRGIPPTLEAGDVYVLSESVC